jgi:hypothetical protein
MDDELLRIVKLLIEADRTDDDDKRQELVNYHKRRRSGLPPIIALGRQAADALGELLSCEEMQHLIRALVIHSTLVGLSKSGGSASPVAPLCRTFAQLHPQSEPELFAWVVENRINTYEPFGTTTFAGATSLAMHNELRRDRKEYVTAEDEKRQESRRVREAEKATERLPNAVRRGDLSAVEALLKRGADILVASSKVGSLCQLARDNDRDAMVEYLIEKQIN